MIRISGAVADITPSGSCGLGGYSGTVRNWRTIADRLEANIVVLRTPEEFPVVLVSVDTLFADASLVETLSRAAGIPSSRIVLVASHTHNAPAASSAVPLLGAVDAGYLAYLTAALSEGIQRSLNDESRDHSVGFHQSPTTLNINRRKPMWMLDFQKLKRGAVSVSHGIGMQENPDGIVDPDVRVVAFRQPDGTMSAIIWSFAAHAAFFPDGDAVSADFPGLVRDALRREFGREVPILYLPGLAGSAVPRMPLIRPASVRQAMRGCPGIPGLRYFNPQSYLKWCAQLSGIVAACARAATILPVAERDIGYRRNLTEPVFLGAAGTGDICAEVRLLSFDSHLDLLFLTGEVLAEWLPVLKPFLSERSVATGYLAGRPIYMPPQAELEQGGYEVDRFRAAFSLQGRFAADIDARLLAAVRRA
jgi:neutral ceramidase